MKAKLTYSTKRKQEVLMWLINHRVESLKDQQLGRSAASRWTEDIDGCVEREPRKMPDGTENWCRAPTHLEAASFWKIPITTISHWWQTKDKILGDNVLQPEITLVHTSERNGKPKPTRPFTREDPAEPGFPQQGSLDGQASSTTPQMVEALQQAQQLANQISSGRVAPQHPQHTAYQPAPVYERPVYPQAAQPTGPPLHPLYRANFAVEEVAKEVTQMVQNQEAVHIETLLRALALSQALVNDLTEAHKVFLKPQGYPQYYPPGVVHQAPQPPPPQRPCQWPQATPSHGLAAPQTNPPAQPVQYSRTADGRYIAIQPAPYQTQAQAQARAQAHPLTPVHTLNQENFPPWHWQTGQAAGQHKWLLPSGQYAPRQAQQQHAPPRRYGQPAQPPTPRLKTATREARPPPPAEEPDGPGFTAEELARLKHEFASAEGTSQRPIVLLEEGEEDAAAVRDRDQKGSQPGSPGAGEDGDTAMADDGDDVGSGRLASVECARPDNRAQNPEEATTRKIGEDRATAIGEDGGRGGKRGADDGHETSGEGTSGRATSTVNIGHRTSNVNEAAVRKSAIDEQTPDHPPAWQIPTEEPEEGTSGTIKEGVVPRGGKEHQEDMVTTDDPPLGDPKSAENEGILREDAPQ